MWYLLYDHQFYKYETTNKKDYIWIYRNLKMNYEFHKVIKFLNIYNQINKIEFFNSK